MITTKRLVVFCLFLLVLGVFVIPSFALAVWWNPFSWFEKDTQLQPTPIIQPQIIKKQETQKETVEQSIEKSSAQEKTIEKPVIQKEAVEKPVVKEKMVIQTITIDNPALLSKINLLESEIEKLKAQLNASIIEKQFCLQSKQTVTQAQTISPSTPTLIILLSSTRMSVMYGSQDQILVYFKVIDQYSNPLPNTAVYISKDGNNSTTFKSNSEGVVEYKLSPVKGIYGVLLMAGPVEKLFPIELYYSFTKPLTGLNITGGLKNGKPLITLNNTSSAEKVVVKSIRSRMIGTLPPEAISSISLEIDGYPYSFAPDGFGYIIKKLPSPIIISSKSELVFNVSLNGSYIGRTIGFNFENSDDIWGETSSFKIVPYNVGESDLITVQ